MTYAYALNEKIQQRAKDEPEFKKEYLHLSERCKTFVTDLYKCCGNMDEILALLDIDKEEFEGDNIRGTVKEIFKKAIKNNHKEVSEELKSTVPLPEQCDFMSSQQYKNNVIGSLSIMFWIKIRIISIEDSAPII